MTVGTLLSIVIAVAAAVMFVKSWLALSDSGGRKSGKELNLDRFFLVHHNQPVTVDDAGFKIPGGSDSPLIAAFDQLEKITMITTGQGPLLDDVFMALDFDGQAWLLPSGHPDYNHVYEALSERLSLDYMQYIAAMGSADNAEFVIWTRPSN